jgi:hypothetical protein
MGPEQIAQLEKGLLGNIQSKQVGGLLGTPPGQTPAPVVAPAPGPGPGWTPSPTPSPTPGPTPSPTPSPTPTGPLPAAPTIPDPGPPYSQNYVIAYEPYEYWDWQNASKNSMFGIKPDGTTEAISSYSGGLPPPGLLPLNPNSPYYA